MKRAKGSGRLSAKQYAQMLSVKSSKQHPWAEYGRMAVKRGTLENLNRFGSTYREADESQREMRKKHGYTGRGLYEGRGFYGGLLRTVGQAVAPGLIDAGGSWLKRKITGRGAYQTNSLVGSTVSADVAKFSSANDETGAITITHREYVRDVFGNDAAQPFKNRTLPINPGLEQTFPWLSQIAQNYEEYELKQCIFTLRSTVSQDVNSNGQVGTIIMCTNYNSTNAPFTEKNTMMQYDGAMSSKTTESQMHGVECDPAKLSGSEGKYIRTNPVLSGDDLKTYDHGLFQLASAGLPSSYANRQIGELWVSYTVCLRKPKFYSTLGLGISRDIFVDNTDINVSNIQNVPPFVMINSNATKGKQNNIGVIISKVASVTPGTGYFDVTFPAFISGRFKIVVRGEGTNTGTISFGTGAFFGNVVAVSDMYASGDRDSESPSYESSIVDQTGSPACYYEVHIQVSVATDGVDNVWRCTNVISGSTGLLQASLDISEYNNYAIAGPPVLVNNVGTVVVP